MGKKSVVLTGDRPTGKLHLGHYVGSLRERIRLQSTTDMFVMIADAQAVTDNFQDIDKVKNSIFEVACDYLAVGLDPKECCLFVQSCLPQLPELTQYFLNLVTIQRIGHNPTVKTECKQKAFGSGVPAGFYLYPIYQVADITAFKADLVPVGPDQRPMIELSRDIVRRFNDIYSTDTLVVPKGLYPHEDKGALVGIDGEQKMSKSLNNAVFLSDTTEDLVKKVRKMRSDPSRLSLADPGDPQKSVPFIYLEEFHPDKKRLEGLKAQYRAGGMPDKVVKEELTQVLEAFLQPLREKRKVFSNDRDSVMQFLQEGTEKAYERCATTLAEVKEAMGIQHFVLPSLR